MSTYDAYNLSLRDSTEFTVPTGGGSGSSGRLDIFKIKIRIDPGNSSPEPISFLFYRIMEANEENNPFNLPSLIDDYTGIPVDNEQHEIEVIAVDGNAQIVWTDDDENLSIKSTSDAISVEDYEGHPYIIASGDGSIDFVYNYPDDISVIEG